MKKEAVRNCFLDERSHQLLFWKKQPKKRERTISSKFKYI